MGRHRKPRSPRISAAERNARLLAERRRERAELLIGGIGFVLLLAAGGILLHLRPDVFRIYLAALTACVILLLDHSGLRSLLMRLYPEEIPFSAFLKRQDRHRSRLMESAATVCCYTMLLMRLVPSLMRVWTLIWSICIVIGFCYILRGGVYAWDRHAEGSLTTLFVLAAGLLGMMSLEPVNYLSYGRLLLFIAVPSVAAGVLYLLFARSKEPVAGACITLFSAALCAFAMTGMVNTVYDGAPAASYSVTVTDKRSSYHNKGGYSYYLRTEHAGDLPDAEFSVSADIYRQTEPGDTVTLRSYSGALGIPYYYCTAE